MPLMNKTSILHESQVGANARTEKNTNGNKATYCMVGQFLKCLE